MWLLIFEYDRQKVTQEHKKTQEKQTSLEILDSFL